MALISLDIENFRNIRQAHMDPGKGLNLIVGDNGSGKSSLLESIFFLGTGRSFRTSKIEELINFSGQSLSLGGTINISNTISSRIGISIGRDFMKVKIDGHSKRIRSALAEIIPVQIINPASFELIEGGPKLRREFLDYGLFHVEQSFLDEWKKYKRALQQRNVLLKNSKEKELAPWNKQLIDTGIHITKLREKYLSDISLLFSDIINGFLPNEKVELLFLCGWRKNCSLQSVLVADQARDLQLGYTASGPHRADFVITVHGKEAKRYLSRGQLKILLYAIKLAQVKLFTSLISKRACILVDDLRSELGTEYQSRVIDYLLKVDSQVFITATSNSGLEKEFPNKKMFHVEHGTIITS